MKKERVKRPSEITIIIILSLFSSIAENEETERTRERERENEKKTGHVINKVASARVFAALFF